MNDAPPPVLDDEGLKQVLRDARVLSWTWAPFLLALLFIVLGTVPLVPREDGDGRQALGAFLWIGIAVGIGGLVLNWLWNRLNRKHAGVIPQRALETILLQGHRETAIVDAVIQDHSLRRGPQPFTVIRMQDRNGQTLSFGSFANRSLQHVQDRSRIEVIRHSDYPEHAVPIPYIEALIAAPTPAAHP